MPVFKRLGQDARTAVIATVVASVVAAPAASAAVAYALNSDRVDKKHAVGSGATRENRAGKLVATNSNGHLPNNIITKAPNADKLDGLNSTAFLRAGGKAADADKLDGLDSADLRVTGDGVAGDDRDMFGCNETTLLYQVLTLKRPARIFVSASAEHGSAGAALSPTIRVELLSEGNVLADTSRVQVPATTTGVGLNVADMLLDSNSNHAYRAHAGSYTLRLQARTYGACTGEYGTYFEPRLSYMLLNAD
ncbi:hypothetical protein ABN034_30080 [Actinopolymorpha sp. B11F2]|uniref:hypothetical protein n=1 Tax=Actinopolymorpha sp. B11F2 TaxID=3160862 RepID=UPI0032E43F5E